MEEHGYDESDVVEGETEDLGVVDVQPEDAEELKGGSTVPPPLRPPPAPPAPPVPIPYPSAP